MHFRRYYNFKIEVVTILNLASIGTIWSSVWPFLIALLFFGVIIFIHELGHFTFAKLFKVRVNEFAIGMGPVLFKFGKGETKYSVRLFPIGGYVSMEGEDEESQDDAAFNRKPAWKRAIILCAGAFLNILLGIVLMAIIISTSEGNIGIPRIAQFIGDNVQSQNYGLEVGDNIKSINGNKVYTTYDINFFMMRDKDAIMDFEVEREGEIVKLNSVKFATQDIDGIKAVIYDFRIVGIEKTFGSVLKYAALDSLSIARMVWLSLFDIATFQFSLNDLSGPIGTMEIIADTASQATKTDYTGLLTIMAFITINVGVFNLLPLPALDGGRLFFVIIEGIRRKPVPQKYETMVHSIGIILLLALMVVITFNDILNLIKR
ncbi:MAG: RIP metalloprotease RseP [Clostridia bacterium]|nr:RIP metalloprotease RseP [Clostridia bacterium]